MSFHTLAWDECAAVGVGSYMADGTVSTLELLGASTVDSACVCVSVGREGEYFGSVLQRKMRDSMK